ncbi:hypothetical protein U27_03173 [Candidatus Vecturithrix granuli]|uniref:Uncharacterized protein n=1 Tax=Vecturithrix granuli TaxID=1499967 RepID=A0A081BV56_VECG1|nr:hypothetical protein U27_03173 [Candidatus Vecturithrix granuli]
MAEREYLTNEKEADVERSSENILQDIAEGKENLSQTVDQIGERIKEKLDWREYVKDSPYWAIGAAAGLGYLASRAFPTRTTPMERIMGSMTGHVRNSLGGLLVGVVGPSLIKGALLSIATKTAAGWIENAISTDGTSGDAGSRPQTGRDSTSDPSTDT